MEAWYAVAGWISCSGSEEIESCVVEEGEWKGKEEEVYILLYDSKSDAITINDLKRSHCHIDTISPIPHLDGDTKVGYERNKCHPQDIERVPTFCGYVQSLNSRGFGHLDTMARMA